MRILLHSAGIAALAIGLAACSGASQPEGERKAADEYQEGDGFSIRRLIGATKTPPDEFAVISAKPLQMPEDFAALPTPDPGARSALVADPIADARAALLGEAAPQAASTRLSTSEGALLAATGTADPTIRATVEAEQQSLNSGQKDYFLDSVFPSLRTLRGEDAKDAIRPAEERQRLSELSGGPRPFDPTPTIGTIPSAPAAVSAPVVAAEDQPLIDAVTQGGQAPIDPVVAEELIFIPE